MANIEFYPGMKAQMGEKGSELVYYIIKMRARDLVGKIQTASEIEKDGNKLVETMVQRAIRANRATGAISNYLTNAHNNGERFMGSFVIATFGGEPTWEPAPLEKDHPITKILGNEMEDFGVLKMDGTQKYFVLDGQHRLTSLRYLFGQLPDLSDRKKPPAAPPGLQDDELSVLLISNEGLKKETDFRKRLRRIFTVINRHAKATTAVENISMDEDDIAAIHTRRLLHSIDLFKWSGKKDDTPVVDINKAQLKEGDGHLTTIATIYHMNKIFINALYDVSDDFFSFSPGEDVIDEYFDNVELIWNTLINTIPEWSNTDRGKMKNHTPQEDRGDDGSMDHLLFWPVGQIGLAHYLRDEIKNQRRDSKTGGYDKPFTKSMLTKALKDIDKIDWDLFSGPWYGYTLKQKSKKDTSFMVGKRKQGKPELVWTMDSAGAAPTNVADMIGFLTGKFANDKKQTEVFRDEWESKLRLYNPSPELIDKKWKEAISVRKKITGK